MSHTLDERYEQCLQNLYQKLPMFTRIGAAAYKPDLGNIQVLCDLLGNPEKKFKSVHIAGTNGKGSVSHLLASVLQTAGYKTGLYTSPHIRDFRERIKLNGHDISKQEVVDFWEHYAEQFEPIQPSFFELTVAMAFDFFATQSVDIAIIEVGLGGLLDSTNIITPEVSVITNISLDHTDLLGKTMEEIARQKAGIIKPHVPVVIGETQQEIEKIFLTYGILKQAPLVFADTQFEYVIKEWNRGVWHTKMVHLSRKEILNFDLPLSGIYQLKNLKTVLTTLDVLRSQGWRFSEEDIHRGIKEVKQRTHLQGRFDIVQEHPLVILDVSHNMAGIKELMNQVLHIPHEQLHVIMGMVKDKDIQQVLTLLPSTAQYYFTQAQIPRALDSNELKAKAASVNLHGKAYTWVKEACAYALSQAGKEDIILVCGSFFILEEAMLFFEQHPKENKN